MAKIAVLNMQGKQVEEIELNDSIFGLEANDHVVYRAVVTQLANHRQGTQSALAAKGNRSGQTGFDSCSAVDRRWRGICAETAGLLQAFE